MRLEHRTRREEEEFLQSHRSVQEKIKEEPTTAQLKTDAIKTMLRGIVLGIMFLFFDIGFMTYQYTGTKKEMFFYIKGTEPT